MEWNDIAAKLCNWHCSIQVNVPDVSLGLLPHCRGFMSKYIANIAQAFLCIPKRGTIASISSAIIQSQTLTWKVGVWLRKTIVMVLSSWTKI